jgi:hypothetical protein
MPLSSLNLDKITEAHLQGLVDDAVSEGRRIEFKTLVGTDDDARKEFLADISSLANAAGSDLLVGVASENGIANELSGLAANQTDAEILRLDNLLRDGLDPRIPGVAIHPIPLGDGSRVALVIRVPRSWAGPHMVNFRGRTRFYSRNSAGKYPLDTAELRAAFAASESARTFVRSFRNERLGRLIADETPVPLLPNPKMVIHLIPLAASDATHPFDVAALGDDRYPDLEYFRPPYASGWSYRVNFDGALTYSPWQEGLARSYAQVFRNGAIEAVESTLLRTTDRPRIASFSLEKALIDALAMYLRLLSALEASPPIALAVTLLGVRGLLMALPSDRISISEEHPIDRDNLIIPETLIERFADESSQLLRPHINAIWNAVGWNASPNYDQEGIWQDRP